MGNKLKSQVAVNFMALVGVLLVVFIIFVALYYDQVDKISRKQGYLLIEDTANTLRKELLIAADASDGYNRKFHVKTTLDGIDYNITIYEGFLDIRTSKDSIALRIPNITGTFVKGQNKIKKQNGNIYLN